MSTQKLITQEESLQGKLYNLDRSIKQRTYIDS